MARDASDDAGSAGTEEQTDSCVGGRRRGSPNRSIAVLSSAMAAIALSCAWFSVCPITGTAGFAFSQSTSSTHSGHLTAPGSGASSRSDDEVARRLVAVQLVERLPCRAKMMRVVSLVKPAASLKSGAVARPPCVFRNRYAPPSTEIARHATRASLCRLLRRPNA